jgi:prevent-host-death family protein
LRQINIHEAKTQLSKLVEEAASGQPFIIAKAGKPMVMVTPLQHEPKKEQRRLGFMRGEFTVPDDFDTLHAAEIADQFEYGDSKTLPAKAERPLGLIRGKITVPDDFDTMLADEIAQLFGEK